MPEPAKKSIAKGARCNNTASVQHTINMVNGGKNNLKVDGIFGDNTESAVKTFQRACGLGDDGKVGNDTATRLFDEHSLTQTMTLMIPEKAFELTGKSLPPPPLLDAAGALLSRDKLVKLWTDAPRLEKTGLELPQLELRQPGLRTATMIAHGVKQLGPFHVLDKLPTFDPRLPHTLYLYGEFKDFKGFSVRYSVDKVLQPQLPGFIRPYFKSEFVPKASIEDRNLSVEFRSSAGISTPVINVANRLQLGAQANFWTTIKGAIGLGGAIGQASAGAKIETKAIANITKSEVRLGPVRQIQIDAVVGFDAGVSIQASVWSDRARINILPPGFDFSSTVGLRVGIEFQKK
jgi:hypothetical protein